MLKDTDPRRETQNSCGTARESSAQLLRMRARVMRVESIKLEALADQLGNLSEEAEEILWKILISKVRIEQ